MVCLIRMVFAMPFEGIQFHFIFSSLDANQQTKKKEIEETESTGEVKPLAIENANKIKLVFHFN